VRRIRVDLIIAYKIQFGLLYKVDKCRFFERNSYAAARWSHNYIVIVPFARSDVRKSSQAVRAAKVWNELPADAVDFSNWTKNFTNSGKKDLSEYCAAV
jgi:hypothetical protein